MYQAANSKYQASRNQKLLTIALDRELLKQSVLAGCAQTVAVDDQFKMIPVLIRLSVY